MCIMRTAVPGLQIGSSVLTGHVFYPMNLSDGVYSSALTDITSMI